MNRRVAAGLLALGLIVVLGVTAAGKRVPWIAFSPGPTVNVLGSYDGKQILEVSGHQTYPDDGALRLVTVYVTGKDQKVGLLQAMTDWLDPDVAVLPYDVYYKKTDTAESVRKESALQMTTSQDDATAAALSVLGIKYSFSTLISGVVDGGASDGLLEAGDVVKSVDGKAITSSDQVVKAVSSLKPGTRVSLGITRKGTAKTVVIKTRADTEDPKKARINVSVGQKPVFPFKVSINLGENIGGPSAGMMFALSLYDYLTPGSITGGKVVAGSGTIDADGAVGGIGGIGQKLVAAQRDGARLFLVADENCAEAAAAHYDKDKMTLVKVKTLSDAVKEVNAWRENPNGDLNRCTR